MAPTNPGVANKYRTASLVFVAAFSLVWLPGPATAATVDAVTFVGYVHTDSPLCYPTLCPGIEGGTYDLSFAAGPAYTGTSPTLCVGAASSPNNTLAGLLCSISGAGTIGPSEVTGEGPACGEGKVKIEGETEVEVGGILRIKKKYKIEGELSGPTTILTGMGVNEDTGETGFASAIVVFFPDQTVGDSCLSGANDFVVQGFGTGLLT